MPQVISTSFPFLHPLSFPSSSCYQHFPSFIIPLSLSRKKNFILSLYASEVHFMCSLSLLFSKSRTHLKHIFLTTYTFFIPSKKLSLLSFLNSNSKVIWSEPCLIAPTCLRSLLCGLVSLFYFTTCVSLLSLSPFVTCNSCLNDTDLHWLSFWTFYYSLSLSLLHFLPVSQTLFFLSVRYLTLHSKKP